jgi:hypothetical protein
MASTRWGRPHDFGIPQRDHATVIVDHLARPENPKARLRKPSRGRACRDTSSQGPPGFQQLTSEPQAALATVPLAGRNN